MELAQKMRLRWSGDRLDRIQKLVEALRKDSRKTLTALSRELGFSVSTLFDDLQLVRKHYAFTITPKDETGKADVRLLLEKAEQSATKNEKVTEVVKNERKQD